MEPHNTFWVDQSVDEHTHNVACQHPAASDDNPGAEDKPFATINQAASHYSLIELLVSSQIVGWAFIRIEFPIVRMKSASISRKDQTFA